jgi:3-hydroxybutyrate dehydrogenase
VRRTLTGRSALVTGSTGGLGHALADRLAAEGCAALLHGIAAPEEGEALARAMAARHGVRASYRRADLARPEEIEALMAHAAEVLEGGPDILVNNAVVRHFGLVEALAPVDWDADIAVNLSAAFHTIRLALPGMKRRGWGRILNMSSGYGLFGAPGRAGYVTTKTALIGLTRAVALETARDGITCNALCPGSVPTPTIEARIEAGMAARGETDRDAAAAAYLADKQPTRRFIAPEKVAAMAAFLCGPEADDITGAAIPIDGGWSAS